MDTLLIHTGCRDEFVDITAKVQAIISKYGAKKGACLVFVPHTTAGVTINENADSDVSKDILASLDKQVPWQCDYCHGEGNSAAHIKASFMGSSVTVPFENGRLQLGTWQGIFFAEFDGPRTRKVFVQIQ